MQNFPAKSRVIVRLFGGLCDIEEGKNVASGDNKYANSVRLTKTILFSLLQYSILKGFRFDIISADTHNKLFDFKKPLIESKASAAIAFAIDTRTGKILVGAKPYQVIFPYSSNLLVVSINGERW